MFAQKKKLWTIVAAVVAIGVIGGGASAGMVVATGGSGNDHPITGGSRPVKYPCSQSSLLWDFEDLRSSGLWRPWRPSASNRVELEQDLTHYRYHCNVPRLPTLT